METTDDTSSLSSYEDCNCYLCQYGINCAQIEVDPYSVYPAAREPMVYYAQVPCRKNCGFHKRSNCFVRAFRWYTKEHNTKKQEQENTNNNLGPQVTDPCSPPPDMKAFATWLDCKYEQFLYERMNACRIKLTQTSIIGPCQPIEPSGPGEPSSTRKRCLRTTNQSRKRRECNKRQCQRDISEHELNQVSMEFIMTPKNISRVASECCQPVSDPCYSTATIVRSQSESVCLKKSGGDYETKNIKMEKPPIEQTKKRVRKTRRISISCQCSKYMGQNNTQTQYETIGYCTSQSKITATAEIPCPSLKEPCPGLRTCPSLRSTCLPCPNQENTSRKEVNLKFENPAYRTPRSSVQTCPKPQNEIPCPAMVELSPSLKLPCPANTSQSQLNSEFEESYPYSEKPRSSVQINPEQENTIQREQGSTIVEPCRNFKEPCPNFPRSSLKQESRTNQQCPPCSKQQSKIQREVEQNLSFKEPSPCHNESLSVVCGIPPKQENMNLKPRAVREASTEMGEIYTTYRIPCLSSSCPGSCRTYNSVVQGIDIPYPSFECHCFKCYKFHSRNESQQTQSEKVTTRTTRCSEKCPFYANKTQSQYIAKSQTNETQTVSVSNQNDCTVQTSDNAFRLDRSTVLCYPFFLKVVCADKL